jgi:hypothetical protein
MFLAKSSNVAPLREIFFSIFLNFEIVNHRSIAAQAMKGLRRNNDAMKNRSWHQNKNFSLRKIVL